MNIIRCLPIFLLAVGFTSELGPTVVRIHLHSGLIVEGLLLSVRDTAYIVDCGEITNGQEFRHTAASPVRLVPFSYIKRLEILGKTDYSSLFYAIPSFGLTGCGIGYLHGCSKSAYGLRCNESHHPELAPTGPNYTQDYAIIGLLLGLAAGTGIGLAVASTKAVQAEFTDDFGRPEIRLMALYPSDKPDDIKQIR